MGWNSQRERLEAGPPRVPRSHKLHLQAISSNPAHPALAWLSVTHTCNKGKQCKLPRYHGLCSRKKKKKTTNPVCRAMAGSDLPSKPAQRLRFTFMMLTQGFKA